MRSGLSFEFDGGWTYQGFQLSRVNCVRRPRVRDLSVHGRVVTVSSSLFLGAVTTHTCFLTVSHLKKYKHFWIFLVFLQFSKTFMKLKTSHSNVRMCSAEPKLPEYLHIDQSLSITWATDCSFFQ